MDENQRILLVFALSIGVFLLWGALFSKKLIPPPKSAPSPPERAASAPQPRAAGTLPAPAQLPVVEGVEARDIVIDGGGLYGVTLSTRGAVVKSWTLEKFRDENGHPLDVVNGAACETLGYPMSVNLLDPDLPAKLNKALYAATPGGATLKAPVKVEFVYSDGKVQTRKSFSFGRGYEVEAEVSVFDGQRYLPVDVSWPGGFGDHSLPYAQQEGQRQAVYSTQAKLEKVPERKVEGERTVPGPLDFAGLEDRYFVSIMFPGSAEQAFRFGRFPWSPPNWKEKDPPKPLDAMLGSAAAKPLTFRLFVAPKDMDVLRSVNPRLDGLVDFGWFSFFAKPLFLALRYIDERWVHNYGWAIVILTIFINLAVFPLKLKSIRSAQEMQRMAPMVKAIQDRYKQYKFNDPRKQKMQQEIMKLYQEHGINPLGGCLPMALQLPILYAFYAVLQQPIELRHAPWIWWIRDLSAPDTSQLLGLPVPILPLIMIVTMFIQQKMTPMATADPAQQRMMMITPIIFGIMFFRLASGLVLYFMTANLVGIAQQALLNRMMPAPPPPGIAGKAAERKG
jgi:YidC/Oxa1 family membrane protein insertase